MHKLARRSKLDACEIGEVGAVVVNAGTVRLCGGRSGDKIITVVPFDMRASAWNYSFGIRVWLYRLSQKRYNEMVGCDRLVLFDVLYVT